MLSGHTKTCGANSGGVAVLGLIPRADFDDGTITVTDHVVTAIVNGSSKQFFKYEFEQDTCIFKDTVAAGEGSIGWEHSLAFFLKKMSEDTQKAAREISEESSCGMIAAVKLANGEQFLVGYSELFTSDRPLALVAGELSTGAAITEKNGGDFELKSADTTPSLAMDEAVDFDTLFTPGT